MKWRLFDYPCLSGIGWALDAMDVGLISYVAKAGHGWGWPFSAESSAAVAIPLVALMVWLLMRRLHRELDDALSGPASR